MLLSVLNPLAGVAFNGPGAGATGTFSIRYLSIAERNEIYCSESMLEDSVWCDHFNEANPIHLVYIGGVSPDEPDSVKADRIVELDAEIYHLQKYRRCEALSTLILCVSESLFIQFSDALEFGTSKYYRKAQQLNVERFIQRYQHILAEWFPTMTIYVSCWEW